MASSESRRFRHIVRQFERITHTRLKNCCGRVTPAQCLVLPEIDESGSFVTNQFKVERHCGVRQCSTRLRSNLRCQVKDALARAWRDLARHAQTADTSHDLRQTNPDPYPLGQWSRLHGSQRAVAAPSPRWARTHSPPRRLIRCHEVPSHSASQNELVNKRAT
jgi:hypothetical protein